MDITELLVQLLADQEQIIIKEVSHETVPN